MVPGQIVLADAAIFTLATIGVASVILIVFDVTVALVTHKAFEVMVQVMVLPAANELVEYVGEFVPTIVPSFLQT